jgi:hypothetical protein
MSRKAKKILEQMRRNKAGWHSRDFHTLYLGFDFMRKEGRGSHTTFIHPDFPDIIEQIPRHKELGKSYARDAVKNIDLLLRRKKERED